MKANMPQQPRAARALQGGKRGLCRGTLFQDRGEDRPTRGPETANPMAFRWYDADRRVLGK
jgi:hypothetical protein